MASTYLFFRPLRLPLVADELTEETVLPLDDRPMVRAALEQSVTGIDWVSDDEGRAELGGNQVEFHLPREGGTLSLRCSLRADYSPVVQRLCDRLGWLAFDEGHMCYQPHEAPFRA